MAKNKQKTVEYTATIDYNTEYIGGIWPSDNITVSVGPADDKDAAIDKLMQDAEKEARESILAAYLEDTYTVDVTAHIQITDADGDEVAWTEVDVRDDITDDMIPVIKVFPVVRCDNTDTGAALEITHYGTGDVDDMAYYVEDAITTIIARLMDGDQTYIANAVSVDLDTGYVIITDEDGEEEDYQIEWHVWVYAPESNPSLCIDCYISDLQNAIDQRAKFNRDLERCTVFRGYNNA